MLNFRKNQKNEEIGRYFSVILNKMGKTLEFTFKYKKL